MQYVYKNVQKESINFLYIKYLRMSCIQRMIKHRNIQAFAPVVIISERERVTD